jgi:hypothetical protein
VNIIRAVGFKGTSIFLTPCLPRPQQAAGVPLPCSRLRLSSRGCHGDFTTRACTFVHARGVEAGGCTCRRAAIIGHHRRGGACRHNSATPRHFPPCLPFFWCASPRAGPAAPAGCRAAFVAAPAPISPHTPLPLSAKTKAGEARDTTYGTLATHKKEEMPGVLKNNTGLYEPGISFIPHTSRWKSECF